MLFSVLRVQYDVVIGLLQIEKKRDKFPPENVNISEMQRSQISKKKQRHFLDSSQKLSKTKLLISEVQLKMLNFFFKISEFFQHIFYF